MSETAVVGTVRGKYPDGSYLVVKRDGRPLIVEFRGPAPTVGMDVIGSLTEEDGRLRMTVRPTLTEALLDGPVKIVPISKRADLTARVLDNLLKRANSAVFRPGDGMAIERLPRSDDPDLSWAMDHFKPEAERLGLALNVIDVKGVTRSPWDMRSLQNFSLPADIEGSRRSKDDLTRILRSGFHPACSRIVERFTGTGAISVNFVIPYSPFVGAVGFARDAARMNIGVFPLVSMNISEARRLSSARQMAMAIAHGRLSAGRGFHADIDNHPRVRHLSNCFADAAAAAVFLSDGGRPEVIEEYAALKESSIFFGYDEGTAGLRDGVLENATHRAVNAVLEWHHADPDAVREADIHKLVTKAVRLAKINALEGVRFTEPSKVTDPEMDGAVAAANIVGADLMSASHGYLAHLGEKYRDDLDALVAEHAGDPLSARRLLSFASVYVPERLEDVFSEMTADLKASTDAHPARLEEAPSRRRAPRTKPMDFEFDDVPAGFRT